MSVPLAHLQEDGTPCTLHPAPDLEAILALAVLGTRHAGFNHDIASKLQGLMMSLDEILEAITTAGNAELQIPTDAALAAAQELGILLNEHRALARTTTRTKVALREVVHRAGRSAGVTVHGTLGDAQVEAAIPSLTHALSLAIDVAAGPGRGRSLDATTSLADATIELALATVAPAPANSGERLVLALAVLQREHGDLRCGPDRIVVRLPAA